MNNYKNSIRLKVITNSQTIFNEEIKAIQIKLKDGFASFNYNCITQHHYCKASSTKINLPNGTISTYIHGDSLLLITPTLITLCTDFFHSPSSLKQSDLIKDLDSYTQKISQNKKQYFIGLKKLWLDIIKS